MSGATPSPAAGGGPSTLSGPGGSGSGPASNTNAAADREQKMLDASTEALHNRVGEIKTTLTGLIAKLESDPHLNWPSFLDSYALVSGQLNSLLKNVKSERTPNLKKFICLPLALSPDRDEELVKLSEGRVSTFSYDLVPDYLRTKPDPEVEQKHAQFEARATTTNTETAQRNLGVMEKVTTSMLKHILKEKDDIETRSSNLSEMEKTYAQEDTFRLVAAVSMGKDLKLAAPGMTGPGMMRGNQSMPGGVNVSNIMGAGTSGPPMGKAQSSIKTNIKGASQVHPYARQ